MVLISDGENSGLDKSCTDNRHLFSITWDVINLKEDFRNSFDGVGASKWSSVCICPGIR